MNNMDINIYNEINFHTNKIIDLSSFDNIRVIKILKIKKALLLKKYTFYLLLFFSNDWIGFKKNIRENSVSFYCISKHNDNLLVGIQSEYFENGTKKEGLFIFCKLNSFLFLLIKSKYNIIIKIKKNDKN